MITQHLIPDFIAKMTGSTEVQKSAGMKKALHRSLKIPLTWLSKSRMHGRAALNPMNMQWISKTGLISVCKTKTYWTQPKQRKEDRTEPSL